MPVRFMIAHSDVEKGYLNRNIEKFNHPDNLYGHHLRIVVGSQLMKESYDLKATRQCIIMRRPDNIPALIQIMGRPFRNYSHKGLPSDEWTVEYYILTSSAPDGTLGYEEEMYKRKILQYETIRQIQRMMHIYAIDSGVNYTRISKIFNASTPGLEGIDILQYKPIVTYNNTPIRISQVNTSTYQILYAEQEVNTLVGFIKRAFIEWSPVWTFDDLWKFISSDNSPFAADVNLRVSLLSKDYFAAALTRLTQSKTISSTEHQDFVDIIFDPYIRNIQYPSVLSLESSTTSKQSTATIEMIGEYYMLCSRGNIDVDIPYRYHTNHQTVRKINLNEFVPEEVSMEHEWEIFIADMLGLNIDEMNNILCSYSLEFHEYILRRIINYINRRLSHSKISQPMQQISTDELTTYVRLLYSYDIIGIIIWASNDESLGGKYSEWITPSCGFSGKRKCSNLEVELEDLSSGKRSSCLWCPSSILAVSKEKMSLLLKAITKSAHRIDASLYPVGYSLKRSSIYNPSSDSWMEYKPPIIRMTENNIIVGYDERTESELVVKFKLRNPRHKMIKHKDIRKLEKGTACSSKSKEYLIMLAGKLGLKSGDKVNVQTLCSSIRAQLMYNEILERQKPINSRKRWFYYVHEFGL